MANMCWILRGINRLTGTLSSTWMIFLSTLPSLSYLLSADKLKFQIIITQRDHYGKLLFTGNQQELIDGFFLKNEKGMI